MQAAMCGVWGSRRGRRQTWFNNTQRVANVCVRRVVGDSKMRTTRVRHQPGNVRAKQRAARTRRIVPNAAAPRRNERNARAALK